jgi:hypothetical protein
MEIGKGERATKALSLVNDAGVEFVYLPLQTKPPSLRKRMRDARDGPNGPHGSEPRVPYKRRRRDETEALAAPLLGEIVAPPPQPPPQPRRLRMGPFEFDEPWVEVTGDARVLHGLTARLRGQLQALADSGWFTEDNLRTRVLPRLPEAEAAAADAAAAADGAAGASAASSASGGAATGNSAAAAGALPLRCFDHACTNTAKSKSVVYEIRRPDGSVDHVQPHVAYNQMVAFHERQGFDAYRRGGADRRVYFELDGVEHNTSVGNLEFIKWTEEDRIRHYVQEHEADIRRELKAVSESRHLEKLVRGYRQRRANLTPCRPLQAAIVDEDAGGSAAT